jgi:hypothetical protein
MNYIPWSLVKQIHEERVSKALQAVRVNEALRVSKPAKRFRLFGSERTRASFKFFNSSLKRPEVSPVVRFNQIEKKPISQQGTLCQEK